MHTSLHSYIKTSYDDIWFHGTRADFSAFKISDASANPGFNMDDTGLGVFLTDNLIMAKQFAGMMYYDADEPDDNGIGRVLSVKVKANKPYLAGEGEYGLHSYASAIEDFGGVPGFRAWLIKEGYDSVLIKDLEDHYYEDGTYDILCVLDAQDTQIVGKSNENAMVTTMDQYLESNKSTMTFWHGGDLDDIDNNLSHKGGRWEFGPGLYLTTQYDVVQKYAKGSRKLYKVTVEHGRELDDEWFTRETVDAFVNKHVIKARRKDVSAALDRTQRDGRVNGNTFLNILINNNAIRNTDTNELRKFFVQNNVDYHVVDNAFGWGEKMMVLFDMSKIVGVQRVKSTDRFDDWNLSKKWSIAENSSSNRREYLKWKRANVSYRGMQDRYSDGNGGMAMLGQGLYTAALSNKAMARQYGKVYLVVNGRPKNPKRFNTLNDWQTWAGINKINKEISVQMQELGYDGVEIIGREYVNYTPGDNVLYFENDWQLEDYYDRIQDSLSESTIYPTTVSALDLAKKMANDKSGKTESDAFSNLIEYGDDFELVTVPLDSISFDYQGLGFERPDKSKEVIERNIEKLKNKETLQPLILNKKGEVVDGNHRALAHYLNGDKEVQVYVPVGTDVTKFDNLNTRFQKSGTNYVKYFGKDFYTIYKMEELT